MKKIVREEIDINYDSIEDVVEKLSEFIGKDATLEANISYECVNMWVEYKREETGPEQSQRIRAEKYRTEREIVRRREEYKRLKQEFEPLLVR